MRFDARASETIQLDPALHFIPSRTLDGNGCTQTGKWYLPVITKQSDSHSG